jgi:hypothetical protein
LKPRPRLRLLCSRPQTWLSKWNWRSGSEMNLYFGHIVHEAYISNPKHVT